MSEIVWEDPPSSSRGVWQKRLAPLLERPGEWARFDRVNTGTKHHLTHGQMRVPKGTTPDQWEFVLRKQPDNTYSLYARYLPKPKAVSA